MGQIEVFQEAIDRFGPVAPIDLGPSTGLLVAEPTSIDHILKSQSYGKGAAWAPMRRLLFPLSGALSANDDQASWRTFREPVNHSLARATIAPLIEQMPPIIDAELESWPVGVPFELSGACAQIIQKLIVRVFFGTGISPEESDQVGNALVSVLRLIAGEQHDGASQQAAEAETAALQNVIQRLVRGSDHGIANQFTELPSAITAEILLNMFLAGYETPSLAIAWTLSLIATDRGAEERLLAEIEQTRGAPELTLDTLHERPRLVAALNEGMRLYTPLWAIPREAFADDTLPSGHAVTAGMIVMMSALHMHRLPAIWGSDAADFRPERFESDACPAARDRRAYLPFGAGRRICPAELLARAEMMLCLQQILSRFTVRLLEPPEWEPAFTLRPATGIHVVLEGRD